MNILIQAWESVKTFISTDLSFANIGAFFSVGFAGFMTWFNSKIQVKALATNTAISTSNEKIDRLLLDVFEIKNELASIKHILQAVELINVTMAQSSNLPISAKNEVITLHTQVQGIIANQEQIAQDLQAKATQLATTQLNDAQALLQEKKVEVNSVLTSTLDKIKASVSSTIKESTDKALETISGVQTPTL